MMVFIFNTLSKTNEQCDDKAIRMSFLLFLHFSIFWILAEGGQRKDFPEIVDAE